MLTSPFLCRLKAHFGLDPDSDSSSTDLAMGHAATGINLEEKILQLFCTVSHGRFGGEPPGPGGLLLQIRPAHGELLEVGHLHAAAGHLARVLRLAEYYNAPRAMANWGRFQPYATRFRWALR